MNQPANTPQKSGLISLFTRHKVAANMLMVLMILSGILGLKLLNIQYFPTTDPKTINVITSWSGASPEDIESSITTPLEHRLRQVQDIEQITSSSVPGNSAMTLELATGADLILSLERIQREVDAYSSMPEGAEDTIIRYGGHFETIAKVLISGDMPLSELRRIAYRSEEQLLARGIDQVEFIGMPSEDIQISIKPDKLQATGLSLEQIAKQIRQSSQDLPAGLVGKDENSRELRSLGKRHDPAEFAQLAIVDSAKNQHQLGNIAEIKRGNGQREATISIEDKAAIVLTLKRAESGNSLQSARILESWHNDISPSLPPNISIKLFDQRWALIQDRIDLMLRNGGGGLALVLIILFLFLSGRVAFWVAVGIPVSFMATLAVMYVAGASINMISLFALIMALGIIVDDAIVVAEDAQAHHEMGEEAAEAAEGGAKRMLGPVMASSLTTIAAFLPLMLVGGFMGRLMFAIPLVIIAVILASLIESFLVLPGHLRHAFKNTHQARRSRLRQKLDDGYQKFRDHRFRPLVRKAIEHRFTTMSLAIAIMLFAIGLFAGGRLGWTFFPSPASTSVNANVRFVAGTSDQTTDAFLTHLESALIKTIDEVGTGVVDTWYVNHRAAGGRSRGISGDRVGGVSVELTPPDSRQMSNGEFIRNWKKKVTVPAAVENFTLSGGRRGGSSRDLEIRLVGKDAAIMKQASLDLQQSLANIDGISAIDDDLAYGREQLIFALNPAGEALGLSLSDIAQQLRAGFEGILVQRFQDGRDEVDVRLSLPDSVKNSLTALDDLPIRTQSGEFYPLSAVANWSSLQGFESLRHADGQLAVSITANVDENISNAQIISQRLSASTLPELTAKYGVESSLEGRAERQRNTLADLSLGLKVGLLLIYLILTWVFASYGWPILVMLIIPFGLAGAILGHWAMGLNMTILSVFGLFGLSGIVVNDSIILVTFYRQLREKGMAINAALEEAACLRLRAVLLTSLTTIAGLTPLLFETSRQAQFLIPMALSIASGLAFATLLILFLLPAFLSAYESAIVRLFGHKD